MAKKLPKGWVETTLGEIAHPSRERASPQDLAGKPYVGMEHVESDTMRLLKTVPAEGVRSSSVVFHEGDVLYGKMRPYLNKVWVADRDGVCSAEFLVFPRSECVHSWLLARRMNAQDFASFASHQVSGDRPRVDFASLAVFPVLLPPSSEQSRIVAKLDATFARLDAGAAALERGKERLKRYRAAVLNAAVTGELTKDWRKTNPSEETGAQLLKRLLIERRKKWEAAELAKMREKGRAPKDDKWKDRYPEPQAPDTINLLRLPKGWTWATVEQLGAHEARAIIDGPFGSHLKTSHYTNEGPRVIRLQNIGDGVFIDEEAHISKRHFETLRNHEVRTGDLVIRALGIPTPQACRIPETVGHAIVKADCIRFRVAQSEVSAAFVLLALNAPPTRTRTSHLIHGVGRPRLNLGEIKAITLPLPPHGEQDQIGRMVDAKMKAADSLAAALDRQLAAIRRQRQAILRDAFAGKLVPQDSSDEPASTLLGRIRQDAGAKRGVLCSRA